MAPDLYDRPRLIEALGISPQALKRAIRAGVFPRPVKLGQKRLWTRVTVESFLRGEHPTPARVCGASGVDMRRLADDLRAVAGQHRVRLDGSDGAEALVRAAGLLERIAVSSAPAAS